MTDVYYRDVKEVSIARALSAYVRRAIFSRFVELVRPSPATTVLDIGASEDDGPESNMLEQLYPWRGRITAVGLGDGREFHRLYPECRYVQSQGGLPEFAPKSFDVVFSNATLEHVGAVKERAQFIEAAAQVGCRLFIVVPNRWFPIEHHTVIPLLHWNPSAFRRALKGTSKSFWSEVKNLDFLSKRSLQREWPLAIKPRIFNSGIWLGPLSSNLVIDCDLR
jgi:hypothetical protein